MSTREDDPSREFQQSLRHTFRITESASRRPQVRAIRSAPSAAFPSHVFPSSIGRPSTEPVPRIPPCALHICAAVSDRGHRNKPSTTSRRTYAVLTAVENEQIIQAHPSTPFREAGLPVLSFEHNSTNNLRPGVSKSLAADLRKD